jgi:hypothetical protein
MSKRAIRHSITGGKAAVRIVLKPLLRHGARGMQEGRTVWVDPRDSSAPQTLLHELINMENPTWSETQVRRETAREWRRMSWREKAALLRMFGRARIGEEDE